jgi:hypothetical protein
MDSLSVVGPNDVGRIVILRLLPLRRDRILINAFAAISHRDAERRQGECMVVLHDRLPCACGSPEAQTLNHNSPYQDNAYQDSYSKCYVGQVEPTCFGTQEFTHVRSPLLVRRIRRVDPLVKPVSRSAKGMPIVSCPESPFQLIFWLQIKAFSGTT